MTWKSHVQIHPIPSKLSVLLLSQNCPIISFSSSSLVKENRPIAAPGSLQYGNPKRDLPCFAHCGVYEGTATAGLGISHELAYKRTPFLGISPDEQPLTSCTAPPSSHQTEGTAEGGIYATRFQGHGLHTNSKHGRILPASKPIPNPHVELFQEALSQVRYSRLISKPFTSTPPDSSPSV